MTSAEPTLDEWSDSELEVALSQLEWDIRFQQNYAYATSDTAHSEMIQASVRRQRDQLKKLRNEREYRITQGRYNPFLDARRR